MKLSVHGASPVEISDSVFACELNEGLVHQLITTQMNNARQGSKAQKTRSEVSGGGAKPWRQKGTGRARAGTSRGPIWRTGGVTFAAKPRSYEQKMNKKMFKKGVKIILSELVRQDRFVLTNEINLPAPKTKELAGYLKELNLDNVLIIDTADNSNLNLAARNLRNVAVCDASRIDPVSLVSFDRVLVTVAALKKLEGSLA